MSRPLSDDTLLMLDEVFTGRPTRSCAGRAWPISSPPG